MMKHRRIAAILLVAGGMSGGILSFVWFLNVALQGPLMVPPATPSPIFFYLAANSCLAVIAGALLLSAPLRKIADGAVVLLAVLTGASFLIPSPTPGNGNLFFYLITSGKFLYPQVAALEFVFLAGAVMSFGILVCERIFRRHFNFS